YLVLIALAAAFVIYMTVIRQASQRVGPGGVQYWGGSVLSNCLTVARVHAWYIKQLVFPTPIAQYSGAFPISTTITDWRVILSILLIAGILAAVFVSLGRNKLIAFAIFSYFIILLPVSQIIPHHELLADHYLYLPMMSFGLVVGLLAGPIAATSELARRITYGTAGAILIVLPILTPIQKRVWKDDFSLWQANHNRLPNSVPAAYSLAGKYVARNPRKAEDLYRRCIAIDPAFAPPYVDLAVLARSKEKSLDLESLISQGFGIPDSVLISVEIEDPNYFRSALTTALALTKDSEGDHAKAEELLWQAISLDPYNQQPYDLLANLYHVKDQSKEIDVLEREMAAIPRVTYDSLIKLSALMIYKQDLDSAIPYVQRILAINPNDVYANYQMGQIYLRKVECDKAR